ncbi:cadherin-like domain-containing protein [Vibrio chagasii]|nr:cadherin-like domain-containing protein [Vibrio chagasii]
MHILNMLLEALPVAATVEEDGSIIITQEDLLANARDLDGDQLTALNLATDDDSAGILQITVMAHTH